MKSIKIYTTLKPVLERVAEDYNLSLDYLGKGVGQGYVQSGNTLRVFCEGSAVDAEDLQDIKDVTSKYIKEFVL